MGRSTVHYADNKTNNVLKKLHNKLRPAGTPVQRVEYIIELLLLRIFETKKTQVEEFKPLRKLFTTDYRWKNPKTETIKSFEETLKRYRSELGNNPGSTFYSGLIKNTEEYIAELKEELKKQKPN